MTQQGHGQLGCDGDLKRNRSSKWLGLGSAHKDTKAAPADVWRGSGYQLLLSVGGGSGREVVSYQQHLLKVFMRWTVGLS